MSGTPALAPFRSDPQAAAPPRLQVVDLTAGYGKAVIVRQVSFQVAPGEVAAILGPNGSGKSTLVKAVYGLAGRFGGQVLFEGTEVSAWPVEAMARAGIGYVPQRENVFPGLSVHENLEMATFVRPDWRRALGELEALYQRFPTLSERRRQLAGTLSGGERQMLAMARALVGKPRVLLLDEPTAALSVKVADELFQIITEVASEGISVVLVEQNTAGALAVSGRAYVLANGEVIASGPSSRMGENEEVVDRVFGRSHRP